jgi:hypothetical protein
MDAGEGRVVAGPKRRGGSVVASVLAAALAVAPAAASPYGVNAHVPSPELLDRVAASGVRWVRVDVLWSWVEPEPDRFEWALYDAVADAAAVRGLRLYATISDTPAWATDGPAGRGVPRSAADWYDICYRAAARYRGRIDHWGMWNEPNGERFWAGGRSDYIDVVLKPGAAAVRAASPTARVCGPELAHLQSRDWDTWLRTVLKRASADLDVVTHHIYPDGASSRSVVDLLARGSSYPWDPPSVRRVLAEAGWLGKPFWLTETGCTGGATGSGEPAQAAFVGNLSQALFGPGRSVAWVHKVFFYELADDPRFATAALGLLGPPPAYREKPAFDELRRVTAEVAVDDAEVLAAELPDWLPPGGRAQGWVIVRNAGTIAWTAAGGYRLAATGDGPALAAIRHDLAAGEVVAPGESREFVLDLQAPATSTSAGAPIVSSWQMIREGRWRFGEIAGARIAVGEGGRVRARVVPLAAGLTDGAGAAVRSDLALHNRGTVALTTSLSYLAEGGDNTFARTSAVTVPPGATVVLADVVAGRFGATGRGALRVTAPSAAVLAGATALVGGGETGAAFFAPAQGSETAIPPGGEGRVLRLARAASASSLRSDLVLLNPAEGPAVVDVEVRDDRGAALGTLTYLLEPFEVRVVEDLLGAAGGGAARHASAVVRPGPDGDGVHAWALRVAGGAAPEIVASAVATDEPVLLAPVRGGSRLRAGAWRTDVQLVNPDPAPAVVTLALLTAAGQSAGMTAVDLELAGGENLVIDDALASLFSFRGSGALLVTPRSGRVATAAGTTLSRGSSAAGGAIAPVPVRAAVGDGGECRLFPVTREGSASGARTHLGLVNLGDTGFALRVQVLDGAGKPLGSFPLFLAAREHREVADALHDVPAVDGGAHALVLRPFPDGGRFLAYATVTKGSGGGAIHVPCT